METGVKYWGGKQNQNTTEPSGLFRAALAVHESSIGSCDGNRKVLSRFRTTMHAVSKLQKASNLTSNRINGPALIRSACCTGIDSKRQHLNRACNVLE